MTDNPTAAGPDRYEDASRWAENDMTIAERGVLRGTDAAAYGRDVLARAAGRPSLDPASKPGQRSPVRQVRLPVALNERLSVVAKDQHRRPSDVIRAALTSYLDQHPTR